MPYPYLIYVTPDGEIREDPRLQALAFGDRLLTTDDLIPLPDGVTLSMMPDRLAVGRKRNGEQQVAPTIAWLGRCCPAAHWLHTYTAPCLRESTGYRASTLFWL